MDERLKTLKKKQNQQALVHITFTNANKQAVLDRINRKKLPLRLIPQMALVLFSLVAIGSLYFLIAGNPPEEMAIETISDTDTPQSLQHVAVTGDLFTIEWLSDAMDRGNHDYLTSYHSPLVIDPEVSTFKRGDVVYYETPASAIKMNPQIPAQNIGRIVGLPGETIEIIDGQVWINNQKLVSFYAQATMHGLNETAYFEKVDPSNIVDEEAIRAYFSTSLPAAAIGENEVFVLVDQWWRGTDSKDYGPLQTEQIIGLVKGYAQ
ncbi:MAG: signal peptidase I [Lysinibacillus sp.]